MIERLLSTLFPPKLPSGMLDKEVVSWRGGDLPEVSGDGIVWRGYDVRLDGIERQRLHELGRV